MDTFTDSDGKSIEEKPAPVAGFTENGGGSLIDLIKSDLQELANERNVTIPVMGYEQSGLAIKYRMPEGGKELDLIAQKCERESKERWDRNFNIAMDTMIALCEGFFVKPAGVEEYVLLDPQDTNIPIRFDARLAVIIGLQEDAPARSVVKKLFDGNELAISGHAEKLGRWLSNTKADLESEVWQLGN